MRKILFIQGGGDGGYEADAKLVASLRAALGETYEVRYPQMPSDETLPDFGWPEQIGKEISGIKGKVILVGHSLGASMLLKFLSENEIRKQIAGIFLIATPFWSSEEDWVQGLKLQVDFADKLSKDVPVFFYHSRDEVGVRKVVKLFQVLHWASKARSLVESGPRCRGGRHLGGGTRYHNRSPTLQSSVTMPEAIAGVRPRLRCTQQKL